MNKDLDALKIELHYFYGPIPTERVAFLLRIINKGYVTFQVRLFPPLKPRSHEKPWLLSLIDLVHIKQIDRLPTQQKAQPISTMFVNSKPLGFFVQFLPVNNR